MPSPTPLAPSQQLDPYVLQPPPAEPYLAGYPAGEGYRGEPLSVNVGGGFFDPRLLARQAAASKAAVAAASD